MILLDTDIVTLFVAGHERIRHHVEQATDTLAITIITRIEILRGRFDALMKAADGEQLKLAMHRLTESEQDLDEFVLVPVDDAAAAEFDRLRRQRKLNKIGRGDLLIASIALANKAVLVTRNVRDFRQIPQLRIENWAD